MADQWSLLDHADTTGYTKQISNRFALLTQVPSIGHHLTLHMIDKTSLNKTRRLFVVHWKVRSIRCFTDQGCKQKVTGRVEHVGVTSKYLATDTISPYIMLLHRT
jgi:hypothetical protein